MPKIECDCGAICIVSTEYMGSLKCNKCRVNEKDIPLGTGHKIGAMIRLWLDQNDNDLNALSKETELSKQLLFQLVQRSKIDLTLTDWFKLMAWISSPSDNYSPINNSTI